MMASDLQVLGPAQSSSATAPANGAAPRLQPHEILSAKVLRSMPGGAALLSIKGKQVPVKTNIRLQTGQSVTLQVKTLTPATILQLVGATGTNVKAGRFTVLLNAMAENTWKLTMDAILRSSSGTPALNRLAALIQDASQGLFRNPDSDLLALLISKTGFSLESKLKKAVLTHKGKQFQLESLLRNDLKALLLKAINLKAQPQRELKQLLSVIENFQLLNQENLQKGGRIFIPIPMLFEDGFFTIGQLMIARDQSEQPTHGKHATTEPVYTARLQLKLSRLGTLRAEIQLCAKQVSVNFLVSEPESKNIIQRQLDSFVQALADKGFGFKAVGCTIADSETDMPDLISEFMPAETNVLCLTA